jgi:cyclopropane-fatty-acyl-phospholipid synthase
MPLANRARAESLPMSLLSLEHSRAAYRADFIFYGVLLGIGMPVLLWSQTVDGRIQVALWTAIGLLSWSPLEYLLHRYVLHGIRPFSDWHALHHARPTALVASPTVMTLALFGLLVLWPATELLDWPRAVALTWGLVAGYLAYSTTHHATHHWLARSRWLMDRKRWHAMHQHSPAGGHYGVTGTLWDRLLRSDGAQTAKSGT